MYQFKAPHRPCDPAPEYMDYLKGVTLLYPATYEDDYEGRPAAADAWNHIDGRMNCKDLKLHHPEELIASLKTRLGELQQEFGMTKTHEELRGMTDAIIERRYVKEPAN